MNLRVETASGAVWDIDLDTKEFYRSGPESPVKNAYVDLEIHNLVLGEPAHFKSITPGNGNIYTTEVTNIWLYL